MNARESSKSLFFYAKLTRLSTGPAWAALLRSLFFSILALTFRLFRGYHAALMLDCLPQQIEPVGLADVGRSFRGEVAVRKLSRLSPLLASSDGKLKVQMDFRLDERRIRTLSGTIEGELSLVCQRCLKPLRFPVDLSFSLGIVTDESEIDRLPDGYEPLLVAGEPLQTSVVIEDEILLAVPAIPLHEGDARCVTGYENRPLPAKDNPFSVLEKLKS